MTNANVYYQVQHTYCAGGFDDASAIVFASGWYDLPCAESRARTIVEGKEPPFVRIVVVKYETPTFEDNAYWCKPVLKGFLDIISKEEWIGCEN